MCPIPTCPKVLVFLYLGHCSFLLNIMGLNWGSCWPTLIIYGRQSLWLSDHVNMMWSVSEVSWNKEDVLIEWALSFSKCSPHFSPLGALMSIVGLPVRSLMCSWNLFEPSFMWVHSGAVLHLKKDSPDRWTILLTLKINEEEFQGLLMTPKVIKVIQFEGNTVLWRSPSCRWSKLAQTHSI